MKWAEPAYKHVPVKSIRVDAPDIRRRTGMQHVKDLAADIAAAGEQPIHAPTIRTSGELLCGRDRFAALLLNKLKKVWVHVAECDDAEAKQLELRENIYRRPVEKDERARQLAMLVSLTEQKFAAEDDAKRAAGEKVSEAPQDSPKARARRSTAKAAGVSHAAVKRAEQRAAATEETREVVDVEGVTALPPPVTELPPGFETFGVEISADLRDRIDATAGFVKDMDGDARHVLRCLTDMERLGTYTIAPTHIQQIRERAQALGHAVRAAMPAGLCFYCKAQPAPMVNCNACGGTGVVGKHAGDHVPRELLATDVVMVAVNGQIVPLAEAGAVSAAKPKKKGGKPIHVEVVDEVGAAPRELTIDRDAAAESEELF